MYRAKSAQSSTLLGLLRQPSQLLDVPIDDLIHNNIAPKDLQMLTKTLTHH